MLEGTIKVAGRVYTFTCQEENKEWMLESTKEDIFQELHEENLDQCRGWEWSEKESHKIQSKLEKAKVTWRKVASMERR
jgi:hypothetical protein